MLRALTHHAASPLPRFSAFRAFSLVSHDYDKPFDKILVANRGEIACRVMKTAKALGVKTVAIYSTPDAHSEHVKLADEAYCVGPAASTQSYLNMPRILEVIKESGAQAVHPGYGFLSENKEFCRALGKVGCVFIGPGQHAIEAMGDKITSKQIAIDAGVNTVPGYQGVIKDGDEAVKISREIGYPVMIKASAGGGGKGMRVATDDKSARLGFRLSTDEAASSFGDDRIFIEKFIEEPRHIEIQLLADSHGNVVAFPERECSIQRRNQKVIEESPSMLLDEETRHAMGEQACMLARAVGYQSAGTVEFLCDKNKNFYFLEMNTRLQVEHPVTECVTREDLVEHMLNIAAGRALPDRLLQGPLPIHGWALESRVYAEDPLRNFLPSIGRLHAYSEPSNAVVPAAADLPEGFDGVRCDSGIAPGSEISMFYDPMICKLITHGRTREEATHLMNQALDSYVIRGPGHNIAFLRDLYRHPRWQAGELTTNFIPEEYPEGFHGVPLHAAEYHRLATVATLMHYTRMAQSSTVNGQLSILGGGGDHSEDEMFVSVGERKYQTQLHQTEEEGIVVHIVPLGEGAEAATVVRVGYCEWDKLNDPLVKVELDEEAEVVQCLSPLSEGFKISFRGSVQDVVIRNAIEEEFSKYMIPKAAVDNSKWLLCPMPGVVVSVAVVEGQEVEEGQELAVVEAMKMQNVLRAEKKGVVSKVLAGPGQSLRVDDIILEFVVEEKEAVAAASQ